jgi:hypothetical protein
MSCELMQQSVANGTPRGSHQLPGFLMGEARRRNGRPYAAYKIWGRIPPPFYNSLTLVD